MAWIAAGAAFTLAAIALALAAFLGSRFGWPRKARLLLLFAALGLALAPGIAWAWSRAAGPPPLSRAEQIMAESYRGKYGGLTTYHSFGSGKSKYNAPDILEAGGFLKDVRYTPDGAQVESFWIQTLQGNRFQFLVLPEIVPMNSELWNAERFKVYSQCRCLVALHFTKQPVGNVVIMVFAVEQKEYE